MKDCIQCSLEISHVPPEGFLPAALELGQLQKSQGQSYAEIAAEVQELSRQKEQLTQEVAELKAQEKQSQTLRAEIQKLQAESQKLGQSKMNWKMGFNSLDSYLKRKRRSWITASRSWRLIPGTGLLDQS
jgi:predicted RNase H-like nuclease (RuvC/YqgF family)